MNVHELMLRPGQSGEGRASITCTRSPPRLPIVTAVETAAARVVSGEVLSEIQPGCQEPKLARREQLCRSSSPQHGRTSGRPRRRRSRRRLPDGQLCRRAARGRTADGAARGRVERDVKEHGVWSASAVSLALCRDAQPMILIVIMNSITGARPLRPRRVATIGPALRSRFSQSHGRPRTHILVTIPIAFGGTESSCLSTLERVGKMRAWPGQASR